MSAEARAESFRRVDATHRGTFDAIDVINHGVRLAEWQAKRDSARIAELEAELAGIKQRDAEVGEDEGWWIGGAWGDYGEAVVPLRVLSYVIDGNLDEKLSSVDPGFALTYAEQVVRAEVAESRLAAVRELVSLVLPDGETVTRVNAAKVRAILDGAS